MSSDGEEGEREGWDDWNDDEPFMAVTKDVLDHEKDHESPDACLKHCATEYGWDLRALAKGLNFDIYHSIRAVNWIRREVAKNRRDMDDAALIAHLKKPFEGGARPGLLDEDEYLQPYLPDDALLPALGTEMWEDGEDDGELPPAAGGGGGGGGAGDDEVRKENAELRAALEQQRVMIAAAKEAMLVDDGGARDRNGDNSESSDDEAGDVAKKAWKKMNGTEKGYFTSYARYGIHHEMLSDRVRTEGYQNFLLNNPSLLKDKVVLDVGCGTGILCMFAAQAGAKKVIGIDMSDIVYDAQKIVEENGFSDVITLLRGRAEDVQLPVDKVDVIVSEWMGYMLLYESMLDSVIYCRDKYLAPQGVCMPNGCTMLIAGIADDRANFWDNVYGFKMTTIKDKIIQNGHYDPVVEHFDGKAHVVTDDVLLRTIDCQTTSVAELEFKAPFKVTAAKECTIDALLSWFDISFDLRCDKATMFSTGPHTPETHWKQTAFYLSKSIACKKGDCIEGVLHLNRHSKSHRHLEFVVEWRHVTHDGTAGERVYQNFELR